MLVVIAVVVALVVIIAAAPYVRGDLEREPLDEQSRKRAGQKDAVAIADGMVHFEWAGPEDGPKVVLVHGFSSPMFIWEPVFRGLAEDGFRVLRYDLFGRGLSDRPKTQYTMGLFDRQLVGLLDSQDVVAPIDVVGLSMGGGITMNFVDRHPERVRKIAIMAPVGFNTMPGISKLLQIPGFGEWMMKAFGDKLLLKGVRKQLGDDPAAIERFDAEYRAQFHFKGCKRALLSTMRHGPMEGLSALYERVGLQEREGLLFWGTDDNVIPYDLHPQVLAAVPWLTLHTLQGGRHTANYQRAGEVLPILAAFFGHRG